MTISIHDILIKMNGKIILIAEYKLTNNFDAYVNLRRDFLKILTRYLNEALLRYGILHLFLV